MHNNAPTPSGKKRKTWLWVLGWIFMFPVPLTILTLKNHKLNKSVKFGIILVTWILYLVIAIVGGSDDRNNTTIKSAKETSQTSTVEEFESSNISKDTNEVNKEDTSNIIAYAEDKVVNKFITEFNSNSSFEITDISKGNIRTKYFGYANGRYLEMINANDAAAEAFCVTINGGQEENDKQLMYETFKEVIKTLDPSITDDTIDSTLTEFDERDVMIEGYAISDSITVTYVPTKEQSYGKNSCRIDISASNYK